MLAVAYDLIERAAIFQHDDTLQSFLAVVLTISSPDTPRAVSPNKHQHKASRIEDLPAPLDMTDVSSRFSPCTNSKPRLSNSSSACPMVRQLRIDSDLMSIRMFLLVGSGPPR